MKIKHRMAFLSVATVGFFIVLIANHYSRRTVWQQVDLLYQTMTSSDTKNLSLEEKVMRFNLSMDDEEVLQRIRKSLIFPQDPNQRRLRTPPNGDSSQDGQSKYVDNLLKQRTNGFFIECGAYNGEFLSNTAYFELKRNWSGLLIEPSKKLYNDLVRLKRNAYSINACLSPTRSPKMMDFRDADTVSGLLDFWGPLHLERMKSFSPNSLLTNSSKLIMCYPLYSILLSMGQLHVDYFSLDVEGAELAILTTIPFDKVYIDVLTIEYRKWGKRSDIKAASDRNLDNMREFMASTKLYKEVGVIHELDVVFKRID